MVADLYFIFARPLLIDWYLDHKYDQKSKPTSVQEVDRKPVGKFTGYFLITPQITEFPMLVCNVRDGINRVLEFYINSPVRLAFTATGLRKSVVTALTVLAHRGDKFGIADVLDKKVVAALRLHQGTVRRGVSGLL